MAEKKKKAVKKKTSTGKKISKKNAPEKKPASTGKEITAGCPCAEWREWLSAPAEVMDQRRTNAMAYGIDAFDPNQAPPQWDKIGYTSETSQFSSDYGTLTYRCRVCGSIIELEWQDQDQYDEKSKLLIPTSYYHVKGIRHA